MGLAIRSVRETRGGAFAAAVTLGVLILLFVGQSPSGLAADYNGTITANGPAVTVTLSTAGDNGYLTFEGTEGERIVPSQVFWTVSAVDRLGSGGVR